MSCGDIAPEAETRSPSKESCESEQLRLTEEFDKASQLLAEAVKHGNPAASTNSGAAECLEDATSKLVQPNGAPIPQEAADGRRICPSCGRRFNPASFERHQRVCQQVFRTTRPQFDARGSWIGLKLSPGSSIDQDSASRFIASSPQSTSAGSSLPSCSGGSSGIELKSPAPFVRLQSRTPDNSGSSSLSALEFRKDAVAAALPERAPAERLSPGALPRDRSPGGAGSESIEEQEQRVMHMLQVQMEELRDMRRRCSQAKEAPVRLHADEPHTNDIKLVSASRESTLPDVEGLNTQEPSICAEPRLNDVGAEGFPRSVDSPRIRRGHSFSAPMAASPPPVVVGSSAASGSRAPPRSFSEADIASSGGSLGGRGLKVCEDCGRRFNPASFEKHRTVCRSVFGKPNRAPFESQSQRLRSLQSSFDTSPTRGSSPGQESPCGHRERSADQGRSTRSLQLPAAAFGGSMCPRTEAPPSPRSGESPTAASGVPKPLAPRKVQRLPPKTASASYGALPGNGQVTLPSRSWDNHFREAPLGRHLKETEEAEEIQSQRRDEVPQGSSSPTGQTRLQSPLRPLQPCPFCGRSFRAAAFDKHTKVCQSVFPSHDARAEQRYVYDSRRHRLKGTAFEAAAYNHTSTSPPPLGERSSSATPPMPPRAIRNISPGALLEAVGRGSSRSPKMQLRRSASKPQLPAERLTGRSHSPCRNSPAAADESRADCLLAEGAAATDLAAKVASLADRLRPTSPEEAEAEANQSPGNDLRVFAEDRRGRLERARFGMKMGQRPEYTLGGSSSEQTLRPGISSLSSRGIEYGNSLLRDNSWRPSSVRRRRSHQLPMPSRIGGPERRNTQPPEISAPHERVEVQTIGSSRRGPTLSPTRGGSPGDGAGWNWFSRSQPALTGLEAPKALSERRGRSPLGGAPSGDLRSYYEHCLDQLDSIGPAAAPSSVPRVSTLLVSPPLRVSAPLISAPPPQAASAPSPSSSSSLACHREEGPLYSPARLPPSTLTAGQVKPGLGREDPAAAPSRLTGIASEPDPSPSGSRSASLTARLRGASTPIHPGDTPRVISPRRPPSSFNSVTLPPRVVQEATSTAAIIAQTVTGPAQASLRAPVRATELPLTLASATSSTGSSTLALHTRRHCQLDPQVDPQEAPTFNSAPLQVAAGFCVRSASAVTVVASPTGNGAMLPDRQSSAGSIICTEQINAVVSGHAVGTLASATASGAPVVQARQSSGGSITCSARSSAALSSNGVGSLASMSSSGTPVGQAGTISSPAAYLMPRSQFVPRLDMRKVNQYQERIRSGPAGSLQAPPQKAATVATRLMAR